MNDLPEKPRSEPEIIPPDRGRASAAAGQSPWIDEGVTHRIYVARLGPVGIGLLALGAGLFAATMILLVLGAFLVLIPVAGLLLAVAIISGLLRGPFGRQS